ncbi:LegC family aminotransferase [Chitinimonas lacunae]|uniref:LegC family aminotransferase n=1 Tax=Chitinimonas lacunae TaxID=1963018 RepID=A0ABV8MX45_9NEIS
MDRLAPLLAALDRVLPSTRPLALHEPAFIGRERDYLLDCLDSGWVSSVGPYVDRFEGELADFTGIGHAIAVVNGTAALHICLLLVGVEPADEVLLPALTFVATANAVRYCGAIPHFVDCERTTLGIDPQALEQYLREHAELRGSACYNRSSGRRIRALLPMHVFGHCCDIEALAELAWRWKLQLVEDAAEALGSRRDGRHCGAIGRVSALSFNGNKTITTGGGGAILTMDVELARRAKHLTTTARVGHRWAFVHDEVGYNYRLPNLNAALGCAQLERLNQLLDDKRALAERYREALAPLSGVRFLTEPPGCRSNYWLNAVLLEGELAGCRDELLERSNAAGLMTRPLWTPMHWLPMYAEFPRMALPVTEAVAACLVNLPSSAWLGQGVPYGTT